MKFVLLVSWVGLCFSLKCQSTFLENQLRYARVRVAKVLAEDVWAPRFAAQQIAFPPQKIFFRAFKSEGQLEVWALCPADTFKLIHTYEICKSSGKLGPKRKEGDLQVPEGFYHITTFNPASRFYLSLKINYPNASDGILSDKSKPGGDIYIHGDCVTIGCIPITNQGIKELYWLAVLAYANSAEIPIHLFPFRFSSARGAMLMSANALKPELFQFWKNLKVGFDYFEKHHQLPACSVNSYGRYTFQ